MIPTNAPVSSIPPDIYAKLNRAEAKLLSLQSAIEEWRDLNKIRLEAELRPQRHGVNLKCHMQDIHAPLMDWKLEFGEIVYSLRSSLDNLVYYCATLKSSPPKKPRSLYFPIFSTEDSYRKSAKEITSQLQPAIAELIEKIQPYHRSKPEIEGTPDTDPLIFLSHLSNHDKHRFPIPILIPPREMSFKQQCQFYSDADAAANVPPNVIIHLDALVHGKNVMEYVTNCPIKEVSGEFQIKVNVAIELNGQPQEALLVVRQLVWYTKLVVSEFEKVLTVA